MTKQITTRTANTSGLAANQVISSASEIADRTANATAITNNSEVLQEVRTFMEALNQSDSIRYVDYTKFSNGTNQLDIVANAVTWWDKSVYDADKTADADLTGWPAITLSSLSNDTEYYIWATFVSGTKSYEATATTAALPANIDEKVMIAHVSVNGSGVLTRTDIWQGPDQNVANYWKKDQTFQKDITVRGDVQVDGTFTTTGDVVGIRDNLVQIQYAETATTGSFATPIPLDDTIPQNTEGTEQITVSITPTDATHILYIEAFFSGSNQSSGRPSVMALFQDSTADAIYASNDAAGGSGAEIAHYASYRMVAGTTSATTFKMRYGTDSGTCYRNANSSGVRRFGGVNKTWIKVTEVKA